MRNCALYRKLRYKNLRTVFFNTGSFFSLLEKNLFNLLETRKMLPHSLFSDSIISVNQFFEADKRIKTNSFDRLSQLTYQEKKKEKKRAKKYKETENLIY